MNRMDNSEIAVHVKLMYESLLPRIKNNEYIEAKIEYENLNEKNHAQMSFGLATLLSERHDYDIWVSPHCITSDIERFTDGCDISVDNLEEVMITPDELEEEMGSIYELAEEMNQ